MDQLLLLFLLKVLLKSVKTDVSAKNNLSVYSKHSSDIKFSVNKQNHLGMGQFDAIIGG